MTISILNDDKTCYVCGSPNVERHHIYEGWANRRQSEKYGCVCFLCREHHTGKHGAHFDRKLDLMLKTSCQIEWERRFGDREKFRRTFGKSYL